MKVRIIEEQAFVQMQECFAKFADEIIRLCDPPEKSRHWLDNQDICQLLDVSKRTLQYYRDNRTLPFSQLGNKCYYKPADIEKLIEKSYIKSHSHGHTGK